MNPITVYCAHCHRPLARELQRVEVQTEACVRQQIARWAAWPDGQGRWLIDGNLSNSPDEWECGTMVMYP